MNHSIQSVCRLEHVQGFLQDTLSSEDQVVFITHLDQCLDCRQRLEQSAGDDTAWQTVGIALREADLLDCSQGISKGISQGIPNTGDEPASLPSSSIPPWELVWVSQWLGASSDPEAMGRIGLFEALRIIGVGGTGVVFLAKEPALGRNVAIKVLNPHIANSLVARQRFEREARATASLVHDNIISIYQVSEWRGLPYLVMQHFPEGSLQRYLLENGKMDIKFALEVAEQVGQGLILAHEQGVVHRDIKPANILLANHAQRAVLTDFGLARSDADIALTKTGILAGTPQFMSPEQARGEDVDARSDLFSLGGLLFAMLAGHPPMHGESDAAAIQRMAIGRLPSLDTALADVPAWLSKMIGCLLNERKENRPVSAVEVVRWLKQALAHVRAPHRNVAPATPSLESFSQKRQPSRWRKLTAGAGIVGLILAFLTVATWYAILKRGGVVSGSSFAYPQFPGDQVPREWQSIRWAHFFVDAIETKYELVKVSIVHEDSAYGQKASFLPERNVVEQGERFPRSGHFYFRLPVRQQYTIRSTWNLVGNYRVDSQSVELEDKLSWDETRPAKITLLPPDARDESGAPQKPPSH